MFELMRPEKEMVGKRIRYVKEELGVSFSEMGDRLGVIKSTINSYAQGYTLAPLEIIEQLTKITGRSIAWFYFGEMEEYIRDYLLKKGHKILLQDYPEIPNQLKAEFINNTDECWGWENEFGYPYEVSLDDIFSEVYHKIMKQYISEVAKEYIKKHTSFDRGEQEEAVCLLSTEVYDWFNSLRDYGYGDRRRVESDIEVCYERHIKDTKIIFNDEYLVGKLINILADDEETLKLMNGLSMQLTHKGGMNLNFSGRKLIDIFQSMRPNLMKLYQENTSEEFYDWFEK